MGQRKRKNEADDAATTAMRDMFDSVNMAGTVVIGEGELMKHRCCILVKNQEQ